MLIPIVFPSAGSIWIPQRITAQGNAAGTGLQRTDLPEKYELYLDKTAIQSVLTRYQLQAPLTLLAPCANARRENRMVSCISRPDHYPAGAFVELDRCLGSDNCGTEAACRVLLASPELCFLQAASRLPFFETVKFGFDLCAMYMPDDAAEHGQSRKTPATNIETLAQFLRRADGLAGSLQARKALRYIRDRSNSPMETRLAMIRILPFGYGGFSLGGEELNGRVVLSEEAAAVFGRKSCSCDALWREKKIALEYDSNETHLSINQHNWDKRKITALTMDGYKVFTITANMVATIPEIEKTFLGLRKMLGLRTNINRIVETREKRRELVQYLKTI